ncbi:MAG: WD40/YVTN/BNR-like repeat-containing protein [Candidatus Limnocylindrales bacterium]
MQDRLALGVGGRARGGDFGGFLRRNLATGYRIATMALDDPIAAQEVVHDAAMAAWQVAGEWPSAALDRTFRQHLESGCRTALRSIGREAAPEDGSLEAALAALRAEDRFELARAYGFAGNAASSGPASKSLRRLGERLAEPGGEVAAPGSEPLETRLREVYQSRDPGEDAPLALRLRLQRSLHEAETAAAERHQIARANGWGFAINTFLAILVLTIVVALASVTNLRASRGAAAGPIGGPTTPLTIATVTVAQDGIGGPSVHVAATGNSLVATFEGSTDWHPEARQCLADVTGVIASSGQAEWLGEQAGHVEAIAGDLSSGSVYASGLGAYCDPGHHSSADGGNTWAAGPLPPGATGSPSWLAFDPAQAGTILAAGDGRLFLSHDAGATWTGIRETVTPIGFDTTGLLMGWGPGALFESRDDGSTWQQVGAGPATQPTAGAAIPGGVLLGEADGMWWFPLDGSPSLVKPGSVFSVTPAGDGAVAMGSDSLGHPWLGSFSLASRDSPFRTSSLPPQLAKLPVTGGQVAANSTGAAVAFSGPSSLIAFVTFAH